MYTIKEREENKMYKVNVYLKSKTESIEFYSVWVAMNMAQKYGACVDVESVDVVSNETGEVGMIIEKGRLVYVAEHKF